MSLFGGDDEGQERTEAPTPKRREDARREGRVPRSQELSAAIVLLAGAALLGSSGGAAMGDRAVRLLHEDARWLTADPLTAAGAHALLLQVATAFLWALLPFALGLTLLSTLAGAIQARGTLSTAPLKLKLSHLDPVAGLKRLVSLQAPFTLAKALLKFAILGTVTFVALRAAWPEVVGLSAADASGVLATVRALALKLAYTSGLAFLALAAADYGFEVFRHERGLRMTKQEVIQEHRETDGNPLVKSRIRSLAQSMARKRMLGDVKRADVVIANPTHLAVALRYDAATASAPMVLAMGERKLAERIKAIATEHGVPIVENRPLARALLATAKVGRAIPADLYAAVAEVLAFVYRRRGWRPA